RSLACSTPSYFVLLRRRESTFGGETDVVVKQERNFCGLVGGDWAVVLNLNGARCVRQAAAVDDLEQGFLANHAGFEACCTGGEAGICLLAPLGSSLGRNLLGNGSFEDTWVRVDNQRTDVTEAERGERRGLDRAVSCFHIQWGAQPDQVLGLWLNQRIYTIQRQVSWNASRAEDVNQTTGLEQRGTSLGVTSQ